MGASKTISSIVFLLIVLIIIYGAVKLFILKESVGIEFLDKLIPGGANSLIFAKWERVDDPSYRLGFFNTGTWKSSTGAGLFTAIGTKCLKMKITTSAYDMKSLPSDTYYVVVQSLTEDEMITAECTSGCSGCKNPVYHYRKVKFEERKIIKEQDADHALY